MKRLFIILFPLLAFLGAAYWMFSGPSKDMPSEEEIAELKKGKPSVTKRGVPSMDSISSEFEDDPLGDLKLEGQVVDEDGNAVVGAVVAVDANPTKRVTSGANGWFSIEGLVVRQYELEARQDDLFGTLAVSLTRETTPITLQLQRGGTLVVTVLDEADRHPISNAKVQLGNRAKVEAITDNNGKATLKGAGAWGILTIDADGYGPYRDLVRGSRRPGVTQERTITLSPGALVSGVVLDPSGQPVADAKISPETNSSFRGGFGRNDEEHQIISDAQGKWQIKALSAGTYRFRARHEKFAPGLSEPITLDGRTPREGVEIRLTEGATISGKVVSARGEPVASALIGIAQDGQDAFAWEPNRKAYSDENGEFKIEGVIKSPHQIVASFEEVYSPVTPVDLTSGDVTGITLKLDQDGMIIGLVVTARSEPVPDAEVSAMPKDFLNSRGAWRLRGFPRALSDADGQFIIKGLSGEQTFILSASTNSLESANPWQGGADPVEAATGDSDVKIILQEYGTVTGKVTFEDGTVPKEYEVGTSWNNRETFSNADGSFELSKVSPGTSLKLQVSGLGVERTSSKPFDVKPSETTDVGTIIVKSGRAVRGTVVDGDGKPVVGATVMAGARILGDGSKLSDRGRAQMRQDTTKEDGSFEVGGLSAEAAYVLADHPTLGRSETIKIEAGDADQTVTLRLTPTGSIEGVVTYNGAPAKANITISSQGNRGTSFSVRSEADGLFRFDRLAAGTYNLTASRFTGGQARLTMGGAKTITASVISGKTESYQIEIPAGVSIEITPTYEGELVKGVAAQMIRGSTSPTDTKVLQALVESMTPDEVRYGMLMDVPILQATTITIDDVVPGSYTLCLSRTPTSSDVRNNNVDPNQPRPVNCQPLTVAESPEKQSLTQEVPAP